MADRHEFKSSQPAATEVSVKTGDKVQQGGTYMCQDCPTPNPPRVHLQIGERVPLCQTCEIASRWVKISDATEFGR